jgi:Tfp pilus assembly protein PilE
MNQSQTSPRHQRGVTLLGLMFWAVLIGVVAMLVLNVLPTVNEYATIQKAVTKLAKEGTGTVPEIRAAFERTKQIEYSISSIGSKDLDITKENEKLVIRFAYDKEIMLFEPVYLLIKYKGVARSN